MTKGEAITIQLRESPITRIITIRNQLLGDLQMELRDCDGERVHLQNKLDYFSGLSIQRLATLYFISGLTIDTLVQDLKRTIFQKGLSHK